MKIVIEIVSFPIKHGDFPQLCLFTRQSDFWLLSSSIGRGGAIIKDTNIFVPGKSFQLALAYHLPLAVELAPGHGSKVDTPNGSKWFFLQNVRLWQARSSSKDVWFQPKARLESDQDIRGLTPPAWMASWELPGMAAGCPNLCCFVSDKNILIKPRG